MSKKLKNKLCEFDACHEFTPKVSNVKYCPDCQCKRLSDLARKRVDPFASEEEKFQQPLSFSVTKIRDLPDGYKVLIINDLQIPFQDKPVLFAVEKFARDFQPDLEIYNGDIFDFYSISDYNKNPSRRFNFQSELDESREFLFRRSEANPDARKFLIEGNHEDRVRRFLWKHGPELNSLRSLSLEGLLGLESMGIEHTNYNSIVDVLGFQIQHGYKSAMSSAYPVNVSRFMATATASSGLVGHTHRVSLYNWTDSRGNHSYIENGSLCINQLEYKAFPNWAQAFTWGVVQKGKLHTNLTIIYPEGFYAGGEFYPVLRK